jgi:hypothetical protein
MFGLARGLSAPFAIVKTLGFPDALKIQQT